MLGRFTLNMVSGTSGRSSWDAAPRWSRTGAVPIALDLPIDGGQARLEPRQLAAQPIAFAFEDRDLPPRRLSSTLKPDEAPHAADGHPGRGEEHYEAQPPQVVVGVPAVTIREARDRLNQPDPLVVPERVRAESGRSGGLPDGVPRSCHVSGKYAESDAKSRAKPGVTP